jgi:hypothetical protein
MGESIIKMNSKEVKKGTNYTFFLKSHTIVEFPFKK